MMLTESQIAEIEDLLAKATPGEWSIVNRGMGVPGIASGDMRICICDDWPISRDNARLIAALRNAAPALLDAAQKLALLGELTERLNRDIDDREKDYCPETMRSVEYAEAAIIDECLSLFPNPAEKK